MKRLWSLIGRLAFWLCWPALVVYLARSKRTRIVVVCGDEVLVVRGWLSSGRWGLPGGGLHRGEEPRIGAVRELREETNIEVNATKLQKLYTGRLQSEHGFRYAVEAYALPLSHKPSIKKQSLELTHIAWMDKDTLLQDPSVARDVRELVSAFYGE